MPQRLAISYVRFSTAGQAAGDSTRRQTEATEAYCKKMGLTLTDSFRLKDSGKSAFKGANRSATAALGLLEKQVEEGKIPKGTVLIVENLDRLSREDITTAQLLLLKLIDQGIEIVALSDNERRYSRATLAANPFELIVSIMVMSRAHEESKTKSYRAKESWIMRNRLAAAGKHINIRLPSWLESKGGRYIVAPSKVEVIKRIFSLYLEGYGTQTITQRLIQEKIPNISRSNTGKTTWHPTYVTRILKSKEVIGFYTGTSPEVPDFFPAIIAESDFYAAQAKFKARATYKGQRNKTPHPFSHLLKCALCGGSIVRCSGNGYHYFQCQAAMLKTCQSATISIYGTETALLRVIMAANPAKSRFDDKSAQDAEKETAAIAGRVQEIEQKLAVATRLFIETPSEAGTKILHQLESDKKKLTAEFEDKRNLRYLVDHRADWKAVKTQLEGCILSANGFALEVTPVSVRVVEGKPEFLRHTLAAPDNDLIALRESLRSYIDKILVNIPTMSATVQFKTGEKVFVEFRKSSSYPRRYSCRVDGGTWIDLGTDPASR